ncbi:MAG: insulinase family protein [Myxococcales bacterium]|nr:insulinase family protein [Myxococcales bacterium]
MPPKSPTARHKRGAPASSAAPRLVSETPFGESSLQLRRFRLANGLTVLLLRDASAPVLSYQTWLRVGSRHEQPGKTGLAHLFEHLMFNETENLGAGLFDRRIEAAGGETNASTWTDWTHYHSDLPAAELSTIVKLEADRLQNLVLREPQVRSEKEVVANERRFRVEDDVEGTMQELLYAEAFRHHPYGHPTIGWMADIEGFTTRDCERFYRRYYAPNNTTLVIAGDFDEARLLRLLQRHYGPMRAARLPKNPAVTEPTQRRERVSRLVLSTPTEKLLLGYHAPAFGDPDYAALSIANELLFGSRSARLFQRLVRRDQCASEVTGSIAPFAEPGLLDIYAGLRPEHHIEEALAAIEEELERMKDETVSEDELERVKSRAELGFLMAMETASGKAEQLGFYETVLGDAALLFTRLEQYRRVSTADVRRVCARFFESRRRTRIEVRPADGASGAAA